MYFSAPYARYFSNMIVIHRLLLILDQQCISTITDKNDIFLHSVQDSEASLYSAVAL